MREPATFRSILSWTDEQAVEYLIEQRWPNGVACPRCGAVEPYEIRRRTASKNKNRRLWRCRECKRDFSPIVGTVFEGSHLSVQVWLAAIHLVCSAKMGISALEMSRLLGISYRAAWFVGHRLRYAMSQAPLADKLQGTVEVDESWVGGRRRGHQNAKENKTAIVALVQRQGEVRTAIVERVTTNNLRSVLNEHLDPAAVLMTDESYVYRYLGRPYAGHHTVTHSRREYARGDVTTNRAEGFFARVKRSVYGIHFHWGRHHVHRYVTEAAFKANTKHLTDSERAIRVLRGAEGRRLTYRPMVASKDRPRL